MIYACRQPRLAMNSCMLQYQNQDELDKARLEWFALAEERRQVCYFTTNRQHLEKVEDGGLIANVSMCDTGEDRAPEEIGRCEGETQRVVESG